MGGFSLTVLPEDLFKEFMTKASIMLLDDKPLPKYIKLNYEDFNECFYHHKKKSKGPRNKKALFNFDDFYFCYTKHKNIRLLVLKKCVEAGYSVFVIEAYSVLKDGMEKYVSLLYRGAGAKDKDDFIRMLDTSNFYNSLNTQMTVMMNENNHQEEEPDDERDDYLII